MSDLIIYKLKVKSHSRSICFIFKALKIAFERQTSLLRYLDEYIKLVLNSETSF